MKRHILRSLTIIAAVLIAVSCIFMTAYADESSHETEDHQELKDELTINGQMNLDVMFVLDASGSMLNADPSKIAVDAYSLFVDLLDDTCGVGYVVFNQRIVDSSDIVDVSDTKALAGMKKKINEVQYEKRGETDIALGMTKALSYLNSEKNSSDGRKKIVILLTDGNTNVFTGGRSIADSKKELNDTLDLMYGEGVVAYAIGLNYDGLMSRDEIDNIAEKTNGMSFETARSIDLLGISSEIFGDIYDLKGTNLDIIDGKVEFEISDSSVFSVSIIIKTSVPSNELNPRLTAPSGDKVEIKDNEKVKLTSTSSYTMIKIFYPESGTWTLEMDKVSADNCVVTQMDFYSVYVEQIINEKNPIGQPVKIEASLRNNEGVVTDGDFLDAIKMRTVIKSDSGSEEVVELERNGYSFFGEWTPQVLGSYSVETVADAERFKKYSSSLRLKVIQPTEASQSIDLTEESDTEDNNNIVILIVIISGVVVAGVVTVVCLATAKSRRRRKEQKEEEERIRQEALKRREEEQQRIHQIEEIREEDRQRREAERKAEASVKKQVFVDYKVVEHASLDELIKKGPEDAFNAKAEDYKTDASLEALISKGPDNAFAVGKGEEEKSEEGDEFEEEKEEEPAALDIEYKDPDSGKSSGGEGGNALVALLRKDEDKASAPEEKKEEKPEVKPEAKPEEDAADFDDDDDELEIEFEFEDEDE